MPLTFSYSFSTIDNSLGVNGTMFTGISNSGQIVGDFFDSSGFERGFVYSGGSYIALVDPSAPFSTIASGINSSGQAVGYSLGYDAFHGFLYGSGNYTAIDDPMSTSTVPYGLWTEALGINDAGQVAGFYVDGSGPPDPSPPGFVSNANAVVHGFVYSSGNYVTLDDPSATHNGYDQGTFATGINGTGQVVGYYGGNDGKYHGFSYSSGTYITLDASSKISGSDVLEGTQATGVNDLGQIVGNYLVQHMDGSTTYHGFLYSGGTFVTIDDPSGTNTFITGINDSGQIVGYYLDSTGLKHGFLATASTDQPPVASNISADANEDTNPLPVTLRALFTDPNTNDTFVFSDDMTNTIGKVTNNGDGTFTYDPNGRFEYLGVGETAADTFTYTVTDNHGASSTATATITIHGENDAPRITNKVFNVDEITDGQIAVEMVKLAVAAYPDSLTPNQYHPFNLLTLLNGSPPDSVAQSVVAPDNWQPASLNLTPNGLQADITYSFVKGYYQAYNIDTQGRPVDALHGDPSEADAIVLTGLVDGKTTLAISFAGTDQLSDWLDYPNFATHYEKFAPLVASIKQFIAVNHIEQVLVSGHSLGGAMAQYFMEEFPNDSRFRAWTIGSPGSEAIAVDNRITNFMHADDFVPKWVPKLSALATSLDAASDVSSFLGVSGTVDVLQAAFVPVATYFLTTKGANLLDAATIATSLVYSSDLKARDGQLITLPSIDPSSHDASLYLSDVIAYYFSCKVADGYIAGANVFADSNGNSQFDPGEASASTDGSGTFDSSMLSGGNLVAVGGADTSTNLPFRGVLEAPAGSRVITPLTTILVELEKQGQTTAKEKLATVFSTDPSIDLITFDPIAQLKAGNLQAVSIEIAGAKVYDTVAAIASALVGAGGHFAVSSQYVFAAIASAVGGLGISLTNPTDISKLINTVAQSEHLVLAHGVADSVAAIIVAGNAALDQVGQAYDGNESLLTHAAAIERVIQGSVSNAIQQAANDPGQMQVLVNAFTGANLETAIATALNHLGNNQDPDPPTLTPLTDQTVEATSAAGAVASFSATATDLVDGSDPVVFKEGSTVVHSGDTFSLGSHIITASTIDAAGNPASETFIIKVTDATAATLTPIADVTVHATSLAGAKVTFSTTASDLVDGTDPVVFKESNTEVHSGDVFALGNHTITASSTDVAGNTAFETFTIKVTDEAPSVFALARSIGEDGPIFTQDLLIRANDPDIGDLLSISGLDLSVTTASGRKLVFGTDYTLTNSTLSLTAVGFAKFNSLAALQTDQAVFHYGVSDGILTTADTLTLTVIGANDAPTLVHQTASQSATAGTQFSLTLPANTFQDADSGDHLTLAATLGNGTALPSWLTFNAATGILSGTPGSGNAGSFDVKVTATDTGGLAATDIFHLTVTNHPPVITSDGAGATASIIITDDSKYVDTVHATDPDPNTTIKYSIIGGQNQKLFTIDPVSGVLSFKSAPQDGHGYQVIVAASDGGMQDTQTINVQVARGAFEFGNANAVDTFVFKPGFGLSVVSNFDATSSNHDVLELDHALFRQADPHASPTAGFDLIQHHSFQLGSDVIIVTDTHEIIDLRDTHLQSLTAKDFLLT